MNSYKKFNIIFLVLLFFILNTRSASGFVDVGVTAILQPVCPVTPGAYVEVIVVISNFGTTPITTVPVTYVLNNGFPVVATYNGLITPSSSDTFEIIAGFIVPAGPFSLCVFTDGDSNPANDTTCICGGTTMADNSDLSINEGFMQVRPNPSTGKFVLQLNGYSGNNSTVTIINSFGVPVWYSDYVKPELNIDLSEQPAGLYLISVTTHDAVFTSQLLFIR